MLLEEERVRGVPTVAPADFNVHTVLYRWVCEEVREYAQIGVLVPIKVNWVFALRAITTSEQVIAKGQPRRCPSTALVEPSLSY